MEHLATDFIYPEWAIWESFVGEVYGQAQSLDALESSHPVEVTVHHADEVNEMCVTPTAHIDSAHVIQHSERTVCVRAGECGMC
jgi:aminopeptidase N